ncbi:MAG: CBS domain-containing protein [Candidatus Rokubacteria bacterium]|nr:CBS domain-containing protein [Candidatus Rokubacteria bacterium]
MVAKDVMTTRVVTVAPETLVEDIARLLLTHRISAVPVLDATGELVGIVSEGDLMRRADTGTARHAPWWRALTADFDDRAREYARTHGRHAADVMTRYVVTVTVDTPVAEIARVLEERHIKRVPVVNGAGRLIGIVSRADLLRALALRDTERPIIVADDQELRGRVLRAFDRANVVPLPNVNPVVANGIVHLWGLVDTEEQRRACHVVAEGVLGVRGVEDHLGHVATYHRSA